MSTSKNARPKQLDKILAWPDNTQPSSLSSLFKLNKKQQQQQWMRRNILQSKQNEFILILSDDLSWLIFYLSPAVYTRQCSTMSSIKHARPQLLRFLMAIYQWMRRNVPQKEALTQSPYDLWLPPHSDACHLKTCIICFFLHFRQEVQCILASSKYMEQTSNCLAS